MLIPNPLNYQKWIPSKEKSSENIYPLAMKKIFILSLVMIFAIVNYSSAQGWRKGEMEVRVEIDNQATANVLANLKLIADYYPDHAILYVTAEEADKLRRNGLDYSIQIPDMNAHFKGFWDAKVDYHSYPYCNQRTDACGTEHSRSPMRTGQLVDDQTPQPAYQGMV